MTFFVLDVDLSVDFWVRGLTLRTMLITFFGSDLTLALDHLGSGLTCWMVDRLCLAGNREGMENIKNEKNMGDI